MPASGNIGLLCCQGGVACTSISAAACGTTVGPKCLTALATAAGKTACMRCFYGYDDSLVIAPAITSLISGLGATCSVSACAPAFNTFTNSTACTWLHPAAPSAPSPAGTSQSVVIDVNPGAARCGVVCYTPICGGVVCATFCQLLSRAIEFSVISSNCGAGTTADAVLSIISTPSMVAGDCICLCLCGCLHSSGGASSSACWVIYCSGTKVYCCTIGTNTTAAPFYALPVMITVGNINIFCVCLHGIVTATFSHTCSCANISCLCNCVGSYVIGAASSYNLCTC